MSGAQREMTLDEWCQQLPPSHRVNRELATLDRQVREQVRSEFEREGRFHQGDIDIAEARGYERGLRAASVEPLFTLDDNSRPWLYDDGRSCCESRYMKCDDDLNYHIGAILLDAEVREAPNEPDEYGEHEVAFLYVTTSKGVIVANMHNEHNGYYGGFALSARIEYSDRTPLTTEDSHG